MTWNNAALKELSVFTSTCYIVRTIAKLASCSHCNRYVGRYKAAAVSNEMGKESDKTVERSLAGNIASRSRSPWLFAAHHQVCYDNEAYTVWCAIRPLNMRPSVVYCIAFLVC